MIPCPCPNVMTLLKASGKPASRDWNKLDGTFGTDTPIKPLTCDADCACQIGINLRLHTKGP